MIEYIANFPLFIGLLAAVIHVLAGPDHLAAVAPLALKEKGKSWFVGFFWGIGHIIGMLLIGILFFYFRNFIPIEAISAQSEKIVGVILILIGVWVYYKLAKNKKNTNEHSHIHLHEDAEGDSYAHYHQHDHKVKTHEHAHTQKQGVFTVLGIGIIHGFAGVSHLVGLLPTLAFSPQTEAVLYLVGFGFGTIIAMVLFSALLGILSKKASRSTKSQPFYILNMAAATIAIFVGFFWIYQSW